MPDQLTKDFNALRMAMHKAEETLRPHWPTIPAVAEEHYLSLVNLHLGRCLTTVEKAVIKEVLSTRPEKIVPLQDEILLHTLEIYLSDAAIRSDTVLPYWTFFSTCKYSLPRASRYRFARTSFVYVPTTHTAYASACYLVHAYDIITTAYQAEKAKQTARKSPQTARQQEDPVKAWEKANKGSSKGYWS